MTSDSDELPTRRVPAGDRFLQGRQDGDTVILYDADGDPWRLARTPSGKRWRITDTDGERRTAATIDRLIEQAETAGARFPSWRSGPPPT
jgi:YD repeat-containing protein